jgi:hypothetical protein
MVPTDTDRAHRQQFEPRLDDGHLYLLRGSARDHDGHSAEEPRREHNVGSVQIVRTPCEPASDPTNTVNTQIVGDGLSAARGMIMGVALGVVFWSVIAGLIGFFVF